MDSLLVVERFVIEALSKKACSLDDLKSETQLDHSLVLTVLNLLMNRGIVNKNKSNYQLALERKQDWLPILKSKEGIKSEVKELFSSLVNQSIVEEEHKKADFKLKKIWLTPKEKEVLDQKWKEIESLLVTIRENRRRLPKKECLAESQVLFWGQAPYGNLVNDMIAAV
jgi:predicted transcriptional regulator